MAEPKLNYTLQNRILYCQHLARGVDSKKCVEYDTPLSIENPHFVTQMPSSKMLSNFGQNQKDRSNVLIFRFVKRLSQDN